MNNKKIAILTLYYENNNYGGLLQAYTLTKYLNDMGFSAKQICYKRELPSRKDRISEIMKLPFTNRIKALIRFQQSSIQDMCCELISKKYEDSIKLRINSLQIFAKSIPHTSLVYNYSNIKEIESDFDIFICGSDVVWNAGIKPDIAALGFIKDKYKMSYAPSIGMEIPSVKWIKEYTPFLLQLNALSFRENSVTIAVKNSGIKKELQTVVDPVFLLNKLEWESLLPDFECCKERYIFCYLLGDSDIQRKRIIEFARKNNLKIITFPYVENNKYRRCDSKFGDFKLYKCTPLEFLRILKESTIVISDSFHAIAFSHIFNVNFRAISRTKNKRNSGINGRVQNLLSISNNKEMFISDEKIKMIDLRVKPDFSAYEKNMPKLINESKKYIQKSLDKAMLMTIDTER